MSSIYFLKFPLTPSLGGAEFHTLQLATHFSSQGHQVKLITSDQHLFRLFEKHHLPRRRVFAGWEPTSRWSFLLWPLTFVVARHKFKKILHTAPPGSTFFCQSLTEKLVLPALTRRSTGTPSPEQGEGNKVIFLEHKIPGRWLKANPLKFLYLKYARRVKIITVSRFAKQEFIKLGVPEKNIEVIYPAVHNPLNPPYLKGEENTEATPPLKLRGGREGLFTIGILGRLSPEKGVLDFLQTLLPYFPNHPNWHILIAGEGEQNQDIKQFVQQNNLQNQVKLLGFVHDLDSFFSQISVLAYPTLVPESFGLSILEALSRGIPVIAPSLGAIPEILSSPSPGLGRVPKAGEVEGSPSFTKEGTGGSSSGILIHNPGEWISALESLQNPQSYHSISSSALARAQTFSETKMRSAFDQLLSG